MNIVGSSAMSAPSRLIQTLQAAPDTHPSNFTLLSATQTSLRFNWKVLKHLSMRGDTRTSLKQLSPFLSPLKKL